MKRIASILIAFMLLLGTASCYKRAVIMTPADFNERIRVYTDDKMVGSTKVVETFGTLTLPYKNSEKSANCKYPVHCYDDGMYSYTFDHNGKLVGFRFQIDLLDNNIKIHFPDGYQKKTEQISYQKAKKLSFEFLKDYTDTDGYELDSLYNDCDPYYSFTYIRYQKDIEVEKSYITMDKCGNVFVFNKLDYCNNEAELPNHKDEFYIEKAIEYYSEWVSRADDWKNRNIREQKDYKISEKKLRYSTEFQSYAISYNLVWTMILNDGSEKTGGMQFYYFLNQK